MRAFFVIRFGQREARPATGSPQRGGIQVAGRLLNILTF